VRAVGISLDVTEQRLLEAQFQQAQKMEAVGRLAGGVAHDFNNLLTVMLGFCELLLKDLPESSPQRQDVEEIHKAGVSAAGLTRQLLAFSRRQLVTPRLISLTEVVTDIRAMVQRLIGEDVNVVLNLQPHLAPIMADRAQVEQVIMNLAVNARDAMPSGGVLTLETANVTLDANYTRTHFGTSAGEYVMLSVSDTGTGMSSATQARLFEPFFTTKEVGKGTGLGMATVHGIVTSSGGHITVHSDVGVGTSFKAYFPKAREGDDAADLPTSATQHAPAKRTVLVVEDADALRELTRRMLELQGYSVQVAANAREAGLLFAANPDIDLLLTDVVMPGLSGPELASILVARRPTLRVIYMSGYTDDAIVQHGVFKPGIALLNKPFTSDTLARKIHEVFRGKALT
jgi:nitrogen-specific signal transduction histidine kinase/CheY-like chemotaxis protein